jgi:ATP-dependent RNA helicase DDX42
MTVVTFLSFPYQAVPAAISGRDILGIAKTGSGKTAAFLWPILVHIMDQREMQEGDGPIGLICAPTRELAQQIYLEAKKFGKVYNVRVACVFGGGNKYEQSKALKECPEIVVATPVSDVLYLVSLDCGQITNVWTHMVSYM